MVLLGDGFCAGKSGGDSDNPAPPVASLRDGRRGGPRALHQAAIVMRHAGLGQRKNCEHLRRPEEFGRPQAKRPGHDQPSEPAGKRQPHLAEKHVANTPGTMPYCVIKAIIDPTNPRRFRDELGRRPGRAHRWAQAFCFGRSVRRIRQRVHAARFLRVIAADRNTRGGTVASWKKRRLPMERGPGLLGAIIAQVLLLHRVDRSKEPAPRRIPLSWRRRPCGPSAAEPQHRIFEIREEVQTARRHAMAGRGSTNSKDRPRRLPKKTARRRFRGPKLHSCFRPRGGPGRAGTRRHSWLEARAVQRSRKSEISPPASTDQAYRRAAGYRAG